MHCIKSKDKIKVGRYANVLDIATKNYCHEKNRFLGK
jgi:hypothetical protein